MSAAQQKTEVVTLQPTQGNALTPMEMLDRALASGAGLEVIEKIMTLQERWDANEARKAFNEAFAAFKTEVVPVIRNKEITDGPLKGKRYAELFSFVQAVTPALGKHGLSASWDIVRDERDWIEVSCKIEHTQGHARHVKMGGPPDSGGAKNALQARISTVTYLEKSTLKAVCGIAEQGDDDEATGAGNAEKITTEQAEQLRSEIVEHGADLKAFLKWAKVGKVEDIPAEYYDSCIKAIRNVGK